MSDPKTLVLLPGLDGTGELFAPFLEALPSHIEPRVVRYATDETSSLSDYAAQVADALPSSNVFLLAESFSGLVALTLLARHPARVRGVIFCAAFAEPPRPFLLRLAPLLRHAGPLMTSAPAFILRQFCLGSDASSQHLTWLRKVLGQVTPAVLAHRLRLIATRHPFLQTQFDIPCWYVRADDDRLVPSGACRWFERHFTSFQLVSLAGPHFLLQMRPEECAERVAAILDAATP